MNEWKNDWNFGMRLLHRKRMKSCGGSADKRGQEKEVSLIKNRDTFFFIYSLMSHRGAYTCFYML